MTPFADSACARYYPDVLPSSVKRKISTAKRKTAGAWERKKSWPRYLVRKRSSGIFYARFKHEGKDKWRSLETDKITRATNIVKDVVDDFRAMLDKGDGTVTLEQALKIHVERIADDPTKTERTAEYHREAVETIRKTWPTDFDIPVSKITPDNCRKWGKAHSRYSPSVYNKSLGILRKAMAIGIEKGGRIDDPFIDAAGKPVVERRKETPKKLRLPEPSQFQAFIDELAAGGGRDSQNCARLVRFLAYGGFRLSEAANVRWRDVNLAKGEITVWGGKGREEREFRVVPIIPDMAVLIDELREINPVGNGATPLMAVSECQKAMNRAAKLVGMTRITHHDLRHLFATRCIESGVDIPTVARWLGHKDGGALAMRVYGHLRDQHSTDMAKRVSFGATPEADNVVSMKKRRAA